MFDSNCKKTFHSQALNRLTVLERLTWLIPVGFIVREIIYTHSEIEEVLQDSPSPAVIIALIIAILFVFNSPCLINFYNILLCKMKYTFYFIYKSFKYRFLIFNHSNLISNRLCFYYSFLFTILK